MLSRLSEGQNSFYDDPSSGCERVDGAHLKEMPVWAEDSNGSIVARHLLGLLLDDVQSAASELSSLLRIREQASAREPRRPKRDSKRPGICGIHFKKPLMNTFKYHACNDHDSDSSGSARHAAGYV